MKNKGLQTEWCLLQAQFDSYEKHSLYIKLISILVLVAAELFSEANPLIILILMILWLQDGIWKTFQSRIETRLLVVEQNIKNHINNNSEVNGFQFNSQFLESRLTGVSLISEYVRQSLRPTVAFPHIALIFIVLFQYLF